MDFKVKRGNTYIPLISSANKSCITSAVQKRKLCGEDTVTINLTSAEYIQFRIGDTLDVYGTTYTINQLPTVKKINERNYEYTLVFEGLQYTLIDRVFLMPDNTQGNNLMFDLEGMMEVLIDNINRGNSGKQYTYTCPTGTEYKNLSLTEKNCLQVLQQLCQEWDTEFTIEEGEDEINIKIGQAGSQFPITFTYGQNGGIYELNREKGATDLVTRLFCYGGTQNLTWYRHNRLCLPSKTKNQSYVEDATAIATYGLKEAVKNFDDIYPDRRGTVTSVSGCAYNEFIDTSMADSEHGGFDLNAKWTANDYNDWLVCRGLTDSAQNQQIFANDVVGSTRYLISGQTAKIHFNSGALAGYEVEIHSYNHSTQKFVLQPLVDENGYDFPSKTNTTFRIAQGDEYIIVDINLPESYKQDAESKLATEAATYFATVCNPQPKYTLELEPLALEKIVDGLHSSGDREIFATGDTVHIIDSENSVNATIRIDSFDRDLIDPYKYKLTLTDEITYTAQVRTLIEVNQIKRVVQESKISDVNRIRRGWRDVEEMYNMVFDTDGYFQDKIAPMSIDTMMLKVGARSQQLVLQNVSFEANYLNDENKFNVVSNSGVLVHYGLADDGEELTWLITGGLINLTDNGPYYIYARCSRDNYNSATIIASQDQIKFDEESGWWNFLVGTLGSVDTISYSGQGVASVYIRNFAPSYGYSAINGRTIRTGVIQSADGLTSFDLDQGKIKGNIVFESSGSEVSIDQYIADEVGVAVTDLGLGGNNILVYNETKWEQGTWGSTTVGDHVASTTRIRNTNNGNYVKVIPNTTYTFSRHTKGSLSTFYIVLYAYDSNGTLVSADSKVAWQTTFPFTWTPTTATRLEIGIKHSDDSTIYPSEAESARIKMEIGSAASEWSETDEDLLLKIGGGGNLLRNTQQINDLLPVSATASWTLGTWRNSGSGTGTRTILSIGSDSYPTNAPANTNVIQITSSSSSSGETTIAQQGIPLSVGETYTLSFWARATSGSPKIYIQLNSSLNGGRYDRETVVRSGWARYEITAVHSQAQASAGGGVVYVGHYSSVGTMQICGIKLEKGGQSTDWNASQYDTDYLRNALNEATSGSTEINGGLILTKMIQAGSGSTQAGLAGLANSLVALWAGANISAAQVGNAPIVIWRDGNAKFGAVRINGMGSGELVMIGSDGSPRLQIKNGSCPTPQARSVVGDTSWHSLSSQSGTLPLGKTSWYDVVSIPFIGSSISSVHNGMAIKFKGNGSSSTISFSGNAGGYSWRVIITIDGKENVLYEGDHTGGGSPFTIPTEEKVVIFNAASSSTVGLKIQAYDGAGTENPTITMSGLQYYYYHDSTVPQTTLGNDGLSVIKDNLNFFRAKQNGSYMETTIKGLVDMPGVLWAGNISSGAVATPHYKNSAKYASNQLSCEAWNSTYKYFRITHLLGSADFTAIVTPTSSAVTARTTKDATYLCVYLSAQASFDLVLFGSN